MSQVELRKYGVLLTTAKAISFDLFQIDGIDLESAATFAAGDVKISKDGAAEANITNLPVDEGQGYRIILTAAELTAARIRITFVDQTATKVWLDTTLIIETYGNASAMHAFDLDTASVAQSADNDTKLSTIVSTTSTIVADTNELQTDWKNGGRLDLLLDAIPTTAMRGTDSALLAASINLTAGAVDNVTTVDTTTTNTDMRGTEGANTTTPNTVTPLTAAGVRSAVGLATANMDTQFTASATATGFNTTVPDAAGTAPTLSEILTTAMTESYAAEGAAPSLTQALMLIQQSLTEFSYALTINTIKKLDGITTAAVMTLDDTTSPTSSTRTS